MDVQDQPLVSVLTPVYNGESYLKECIESVLAQTYSKWEYTIVNNCSTDRTRDIAEEYAKRDSRVRVCNADVLVPIIANHNRAFKTISPKSKYCKVVSADDAIFPECLMRMVELAEAHPSIGLVGSYQVSGGEDKWYVRFAGLPYTTTFMTGRDVCRAQLMTSLSVFGAPTSNMYRADLVRSTDEFFPNPTAEADVSACFLHLKNADFGFVHQVLSYERLHNVRVTAASQDMNAYVPSHIADLLTYGPWYMSAEEIHKRLQELLDEYYEFLAVSAVNFREKKFWSYHKRRLKELGHPLDSVKLTGAVSAKLADLVLNPKTTVERVLRRTRAE